jgi:DnaJ domain
MTLDPVQAFRMLGLAPDASPDEVKIAYRDLAQVWHPDRFQGNERLRDKALENLKRINEAYAVLRDYRPARVPVPAGAGVAPPHVSTPPVAAPPPRPAYRHSPPHPRDTRHSLFTGMAAMRQSLKVLWPSATYLRRRRRRLIPITWIVIGIVGLALALLAVFGLWYEGFLDF